MRERRTVIVPPLMAKGSRSEMATAKSRARVTPLSMARCQVKEVDGAFPLRQHARFIQMQEPHDEPLLRMQHQRMQRAHGATATGGSVFGERELEERMQLTAFG